ncbi:GL16223 [Drosophila persimilis]|uniref:GL16223 n=1 Tax=Drosophila persimilis TaxID=7234 RepID=B4HBZ7_DROPE|nr:GL16223 [Drosophila persimilis]
MGDPKRYHNGPKAPNEPGSHLFRFLREELKYDSGYEKRQKAFHFNDDMHISVKELWEAWLRSEVHNWTIEQTTDWLAQSVQLPQYVDLFKLHKVTGASLPR